jgi:predicted pyridoxine 5'-phosphate oxidase superfamily flavin-nucleotide-binding protein
MGAMSRFHEIAFTADVKAAQERDGSRRSYARLERGASQPDPLGAEEAAFIAARDSFYMASVGSSGWPYLQHRGGAKGFVRVRDAHTLAFDDLRGNRQHISLGNLAGNDRVALLFMDYPNRARLKVLAHARVEERDGARVIVLDVEGFDWNCPQHITPRYTEDELRERLGLT